MYAATEIAVILMGYSCPLAEHGEHDQLYHQDGVYKQIFDAMAKSLNIEKIAKTFEEDAEEETHS